MATKKTTKASPQRELAPATQDNGKYLVNIVIERPEPMVAGAQKILDQAKAFLIVSAEDYEQAARVRANIRAEYDAMEARRKKMKAPALAAGKEVDDLFQPPLTLLEKASETITSLMTTYDAEQRRIAQEKQRAAEAEAKRVREEAERQAAEQRRQTQMAMEEIQSINHQIMIASVGRAGVRKGGTLECIRETLKETEEWQVPPDRFGNLHGAAVKAKETAIASIKALEAQFIAKQEQARIAAEAAKAKAAGDAEALKKAQEEAAAERARSLEARKAQLRAEADAEAARKAATEAAEANNAKAEVLEQRAANVVVEKIEPQIVQVAGLQRPKTWKWRLLDKRKLKPEFLIVDEKSINKLVIAAKERAHEMVGEGAIEIYQEEGLRQT